MTPPQPITVAEAATRLGVSPQLVCRWCRSGKLPSAVLFGPVWQIDPRDLDRPAIKERKAGWVKGRKRKPKQS